MIDDPDSFFDDPENSHWLLIRVFIVLVLITAGLLFIRYI